MKKLGQIFLSSLLLASSLTSSSYAADQENAYVASRNSFNFALLKALGTPQDNIAISPYNIASALDLAYFGADKNTKSEMSECMHLPMMADKAFIEEIKKCEQNLGRSATNARAIALDSGFLPTDYYLETVKDKLGAQAFEVNFSKRPQDACDSINSWASSMTKGRITNLLNPSDVSAATRLVLLSAIYIKADWVQAFSANKTRDDTFRSMSGKDNTVKMMQQTKTMRLFQNDQVDVVWMDLKQNNPNDSQLEVLFVVPQTPAAFKEVAQNLSSDQLQAWSQQAGDKYVEFNVPKCTIRERLSVKPALQALGMKEAFTTGADFSGISSKNNLMISNVLHAAFLEMNETGIEAAAASAVVMMMKSAVVSPETPIVVRCDKPFYVLIREKSSGLVLFVSVIASLDKQEK